MRLPSWYVVFLLSAVTCFGCGGESLDRVPVSGTVTLDGSPLPSGSIRFHPLGDGQSAGGSIEAGAFSIPQADGPAPGEYRVEVVSFQPTGRQIPDPDSPGQTKEEQEQVIPQRYNRQSELTASVSATDKNAFNFALESQPND